jgi:hypothetical protein
MGRFQMCSLERDGRSGVVPPFKRIRHLLRDAAIGLAWLYFDLREGLRDDWPKDEEDRALIDVTHPLDEYTCPRRGTRELLNHLRQRIIDALRKQQALAAANGRYWPMPEAIQFLVASSGDIRARLRFPPPFQPANRPWLEAAQPSVVDRLPATMPLP